MELVFIRKGDNDITTVKSVERVCLRGKFLYYETVNDSRGYGTDIPLDQLKSPDAWEARESGLVWAAPKQKRR